MNGQSWKSISTLFLLCVCSGVFSQSIERKVINTVGQEYKTASTTLKVSIGESIVGKRGTPSIISQGLFTGSPSMVSTRVAVIEGENAVSVFPNPTGGTIYFKSQDDEKLSVEIVNVFGQIILERTSISHSQSIADQASGMYLAKIYDTKGHLIQTSRIIKQ